MLLEDYRANGLIGNIRGINAPATDGFVSGQTIVPAAGLIVFGSPVLAFREENGCAFISGDG